MTHTAIKYSFDHSFDDSTEEVADTLAADHAAALEAARQIAYSEGFAEGEAQTLASLEAGIARSHASIEAQLATLISALTATQRLLLADAARCVSVLAESIAGEALLHLPVDRIEGVVAPLLSEFVELPRLVIRVAPALMDAVKVRLEDVAIGLGFGGKLIFVAEDTLKPGDVLAEWAHGGLDARLDQTKARLKNSLAEFVQSALSGNLPPPAFSAANRSNLS
jgi:flagellar biosynthesis/type III secretory pathway protein FliH